MHKLMTPFSTSAVLATCLFVTPDLRAQTEPAAKPATNLPPIIVQASRTGRTADEMPSHVQIITSDEIVRAGNQNLVDVLQKQAGIFVRDISGNPANAQVSMRGFGANSFGRVLILVNGERLNNPDMSSPNLLRIPIQSIKRIEVLHGSQTVLYGDYAEAGVINIITDLADTKPQTTLAATVGAYDTYAAHLGKTGLFDDGVAYRADADWNKTGGYRDNGDYEAFNLNAAVDKQWDDVRNLSLSTFYHDSEFGLPGSLTWKQFKSDPRQTTSPDDETKFESWGMNLGGGTHAGADGRVEANLTASRREAETEWPKWKMRTESDVDSYAFTPRYILDSTLAGHDNRLTIGSDLRLDRYSSATSKWDYDRTSTAGYIQDEYFFTDKLSLTLGARGERFYNRVQKPSKTTSYSDMESAYDAALLYRPVDAVKLFARGGSYYRAPFVDEVVSWGTPNTGLKPETGYTLETGTEVALAKEWTASLTAYELITSDEIYYYTDARGSGQNINAPDDTQRQGAETSLRWSRQEVGGFSIAYDYVHAVFAEGEYDGNTFPMVPSHTVSLNGEVYATHDIAFLGGVHYVGEQYLDTDFANRQDELNAYATLDLAVRYEPSFLKGLRLLAGVDNVCDKEYASYAGYSSWSGPYYYPANARTWKLCAAYTF